MHRTNSMPRIAYVYLVLSLALGGWASPGRLPAQEPPPRAEAPPPPSMGETVVIPVGTIKGRQMKGKQRIENVILDDDTVVTYQRSEEDPTTIFLTGRQIGRTRLTLVAGGGRIREVYDIIVEFNIDLLYDSLRRVAPTATIQITPITTMGQTGTLASLIIGGTATHSEDINLILRVTRNMTGLPPDRIENRMQAVGVMQVQLDVTVARVNRSELRSMSFEFWDAGGHHMLATQTTGSVLTIPSEGIEGGLGGFTIRNTINNTGTGVFFTLSNDQQALFSFLQILRNESLGKLLTVPSVTTLSGKAANILDGGTVYLAATGGINATAPQAVDFGTQLSVLPIVLGNGKIYMEIEPNVSNISGFNATTGYPNFARQRVHATVEMEPGQTFVLGGLIQNTVTAEARKLPVLGDLPFIGAAFSAKSHREEETELIIMVTPRLVDPLACDQVPKVLPGQETRNPDDFELFLEGLLESPRGPRDICPNRRYVPAYKHSPSAAQYPCAGRASDCGLTPCGGHGCAGRGLAGAADIRYPNNSVPKTVVNHKPLAPEDPAPVSLLPPIDLNEAAEIAPDGVPAPVEKDAALPAIFGPNAQP